MLDKRRMCFSLSYDFMYHVSQPHFDESEKQNIPPGIHKLTIHEIEFGIIGFGCKNFYNSQTFSSHLGFLALHI